MGNGKGSLTGQSSLNWPMKPAWITYLKAGVLQGTSWARAWEELDKVLSFHSGSVAGPLRCINLDREWNGESGNCACSFLFSVSTKMALRWQADRWGSQYCLQWGFLTIKLSCRAATLLLIPAVIFAPQTSKTVFQ